MPAIAIIGAGLIGASWAALFTARGHDVLAWDPAAAARADFAVRTRSMQRQLRPLGLKGKGRIGVVATLAEAVRDAIWIQENGPELIPLKRALYAEIEAANKRAIIASSTSSFQWSQLSQGMKRPGRLIVAHPFNPPHLVPLVEIYARSKPVADQAFAFYEAMGKVPIRIRREAPGHVANRLASALWREAVNIVAEGIADVADVDKALVEGPGLRWAIQGAHMTYHLGGGPGGIAHYLEHLGPSQEKRWASLGNPKLDASTRQKLIRGVAREAAGRSIADLAAERDAMLLALLKLKARK
ncbi:3-hydroxyacyl-CoA dehydrogenase NAD-binding domain-containing protein [Ferrovibrio sp.]|uniref:3-hydroxyacyl-CoA dehydrogenase NAD-binding domain-containing protein n=1 Tax=Ferrovibrio sp. TaxID=1917215 RepID=UPI001B71C1A5|nr:3-hydroxyacyl-CoA dehydrogenase NAD-binding domain-containing protein [Ferrovibrio sp.]MBP7063876.1 3-hydroxyacyl-CoA dehydrogenase [Ferrovibrio sp.]